MTIHYEMTIKPILRTRVIMANKPFMAIGFVLNSLKK
jgi:hypothetical protein